MMSDESNPSREPSGAILDDGGPTLVQVAGAGHTGTTVLDLMLGNSPDAFASGELSAWFRPWRDNHTKPACSCGRLPCPVWERIGLEDERQVHRRIVDRMGVRVVSDSSKRTLWLRRSRDRAARKGLRVSTVAMWKDPAAHLHSWWIRGRLTSPPSRGIEAISAEDVEMVLARLIRYYEAFFELEHSFVSVPHSALSREPARTLTALCETLDIPYTRGQERFWEKDHHILFGNGGVVRRLRSGDALRAPDPVPKWFRDEIAELLAPIERGDRLRRVLAQLRARAVIGPETVSKSNGDAADR